MVIIEGMDNSGKSTLAVALAYHFRVPLIPSPGVRFKELKQFALWMYDQHNDPSFRIHDRHPIISESIYGPLLRGSNRLSYDPMISVCEKIVDRSLIVYCRPSSETIKKTYEDRDQLEGTHSRIDELVELYDSFMDALSGETGNVIVYNFELGDDHLKDVVKSVENYKGE